ncbi:MAG: PEP-CTERM sorting domain-containing protein [Planctomycetes bacterium]|nr:PEP-CTERM sorting domain-containing protein [Planctomycetota bacterium]
MAQAAAILEGGGCTPAGLMTVPGAAVPIALQQAGPAPGMSSSTGVGGDERSLAVPEPATVVLLAAGVAITLLVRRVSPHIS